MPTERKMTVKIDGKDHEIAPPEGFLHIDDVKESHIPKDHFQEELTRRVQSVTKDMVKEADLVKDPEFLKRFAEGKKDDLRKLLDIKIDKDAQDITKIQTEAMERVRREELSPLQTEVEAYKGEVGELRIRDLDAQTIQAGAGLRVVPDLMDLVKIYVRQHAGWDPERKAWFIKKQDGTEGFEFAVSPKKGGAPYMTVEEFLEKDKRSGSHKSWYEAGTQNGADFRGGSNGDLRSINLEQYQKLSPADKTKFGQEHPTEFANIMRQMQSAGEDRLYSRDRGMPALAKS
jgi:hypothetical protein